MYFLAMSVISIISISIVSHLTGKEIVTASMLIFSIGDTFSSIIGMRYGKRKFPYSQKTYVGTFSAILISFPFVYIVLQDLYLTIVGTIAGMLAEAYSKKDNFFVPITSFLSMLLYNLLLYNLIML